MTKTTTGAPHLSEDELVLHHYGEGEERGRVASHLLACAECRAAFDALARVLAAVSEAELPEREADYGRRLFERLAPRLREERVVPFRQRFRPLVALAAMLLVAFLLGRYTREPEQVQVATPGPVRERVLLVAVGDHLERSQMVLVELVHAPGNGEVSIASERDRAQDLVSANRLYRQAASRAGERGVVSVLEDLERVLVEVATSPDSVPAARLEELRRRIEAQGILFKLRVLDNQVRERQNELVRAASRS